MPTAETKVATGRASRYLVQLCEHLNQLSAGHRGPGVRRVEWTDTQGVVTLDFGSCELRADDDGLALRVVADDERLLAHFKAELAARVETIGRRDGLVVGW
jgi:hypothetical protein